MGQSSRVKKLVARVVRGRAMGPLAAPALHATQFVLGLAHREVVTFAQPHRAAAVERIRQIVTGFPTQTMGVDEAYTIRAAVLATARIPGAVAEVGVFRGGTARVIGEAKGARPLHLFDTFQGLPAPRDIDTGFAEGEYACSLDAVKAFLAGIPDVHYYKGLFPASGAPVAGEAFSFVHLDVDLYESTRDALAFFYPRLSVGGMLISHDYVEFAAVRQAFDDYFGQSPQPVLELSGNQCLVVKIAA